MKNGITEAQRTKNAIYHAIEIARRVQNITQSECAKELNITQGRYSQMISDRSMTVNQLCDIADLLGLEVKLCGRSE